jgi:hypothetical protein
MKKLFPVITLVLITLLFAFTSTSETNASGWTIKITDEIPSTGTTGFFFQTTFDVNYSDGRIILAGNEEGTGRMFVDDNLYINVARPDGTTTKFSRFYDLNFSPVDLTRYFQRGRNVVTVRIENVREAGFSSAFWLVNLERTAVSLPFQIVEDIPTFGVAPGSFFSRYFYVDYDGNGNMLLAANPEGTGITSVKSRLIVQVWRPDGRMRRYVRDSEPLSVIDLTKYFSEGVNLVQIRLENLENSAAADPLWLVQLPATAVNLPFQITPSIPTYSPRQGDAFGRYFWVNLEPEQKLFLSSTADGAGMLNIEGKLFLRVVHPDGSQVTYVRENESFQPADISAYFEPGLNLVHLRMVNLATDFRSSAIYLSSNGQAMPNPVVEESGWAIEITDGFPFANRGDGNTYFDKSFDFNYWRGELLLSRFSDGQGIAYVDDVLLLDITRPDGSTVSISRGGHFSAWRLTEYMQIGKNEVRVRLRETSRESEATSLWFVNLNPQSEPLPFKFSDEFPHTNRGDGRDFFGRFAFIDYTGDGEFLFSRLADGKDFIHFDDWAIFTIFQPDGTTKELSFSGTYPTLNLTEYFAIGRNLVNLRIKETNRESSASSVWLSSLLASSITSPYEITGGFPSQNRGDGKFFYGHTLYVGDTGVNDTKISRYADGTGNLVIDDQLYINIRREDGSKMSLIAGGNVTPIELNEYLNAGMNLLSFRLRETSRESSSSSIWLNQTGPTATPYPTETPTPIPTNTPTARPTNTPTITPTPSPTLTPRPTLTPTPTPVLDQRGFLPYISKR